MKPKGSRVAQASYILFDTALGECGIVWRKTGHGEAVVVIGIQLPEATQRLAQHRIKSKWAADKTRSIPPYIREIIKRVKLHFKGKAQDFRDIKLAFDGITTFERKIYDATRNILSGQTTTYGKVAEAAGNVAAARAVGLAMSRNPIPLIIPCHRVLAANSKPGGFSAHGGVNTKAKMLEIEGATLGPPAIIRSKRDLIRAASILGKKDARLAPILKHAIDFRVMPERSPYATLLTAVVHQQLSPRAARTILDRMMSLYPGHKFPDPVDMLNTSDVRLRKVGLSRSKTKALKDIAAHALDGTIPQSEEITMLSDAAIIKRLTSIYGVGRWTVEMMLIFNLGRLDVLPVDDFSLRRSIAEIYGMTELPSSKAVESLGEVWRPYRTVATLYLWNRMNRDTARAKST